jgi:hypothetical protein
MRQLTPPRRTLPDRNASMSEAVQPDRFCYPITSVSARDGGNSRRGGHLNELMRTWSRRRDQQPLVAAHRARAAANRFLRTGLAGFCRRDK